MNKNMKLLVPASLIVLSTLAACSSSPTSQSTPASACSDYFDALTNLTQRCGSGDLTGSKSDFVATCKASIVAPGSGLTDSYISTCAAAASSASGCNLEEVPACKTVSGKLADGAACGIGPQCASGACGVTSGTCGTCGANTTIAIGGACSFKGPPGQNCVSGSYCTGFTPTSNGTCVGIPKKGEACSEFCDSGLACSAGTCVDKRALGAACSGADCKSGLYCDPATQKCVNQRIAKAGESCGNEDVKCDASLSCELSGPDQQTCVVLKKLDESCGPTDRCAQFLVCQSGKCVANDPALCK